MLPGVYPKFLNMASSRCPMGYRRSHIVGTKGISRLNLTHALASTLPILRDCNEQALATWHRKCSRKSLPNQPGFGAQTLYMPGTNMPQGQFIQCREDGTRWARRYDQRTWSLHRPKITELRQEKFGVDAIVAILKNDHDFHVTAPQLTTQLRRWGLGKTSKSNGGEGQQAATDAVQERSPEHSQQPDLFSDFVNEQCPLIGPASGALLADENRAQELLPVDVDQQGCDPEPRTHLAPPNMPQSCTESCCSHLQDYHNKVLAAAFLSSLQCWSQASKILLEVICEQHNDNSVSVSDRVWIKLNYNRINGSIFHPGRQTSIWSTSGWCDMEQPLRAYIEVAQSERLTSPLAHLCLTNQYRSLGTFEYESAHVSSGIQEIAALKSEIESREKSNSSIRGLMLWCLLSLDAPILRRTVKQLKVHSGANTDPINASLACLLACHFMSQWITRPCSSSVEQMATLRRTQGAYFGLDVFLPEAFCVFGVMITSRMKILTLVSPDNFVERTLAAMCEAMKEVCRLTQQRYCHEFAENLLGLFNRSAADGQRKCNFINELATQAAHKIMGKGYISKYGIQTTDSISQSTWMRSADCFKVHSLEICPDTKELAAVPNDVLEQSPRPSIESQESVPALTPDSTGSGISESSQTSTSTIDSFIKELEGVLSIEVKEPETQVLTTPLKRWTAGIPRRFPTHSSGMSMASMRNMSARAETERLAVRLGVQRMLSTASSTASRMSVCTQNSLDRMLAVEKGDAKVEAARFSFAGNEASITEPVSIMEVDCGPQPQFDLRDVELQRNIFTWVRRASPRRSYSAD